MRQLRNRLPGQSLEKTIPPHESFGLEMEVMLSDEILFAVPDGRGWPPCGSGATPFLYPPYLRRRCPRPPRRSSCRCPCGSGLLAATSGGARSSASPNRGLEAAPTGKVGPCPVFQYPRYSRRLIRCFRVLTSPLTRKTLVTPAKAGVQNPRGLDSGCRRNDD